MLDTIWDDRDLCVACGHFYESLGTGETNVTNQFCGARAWVGDLRVG